MLSSPTFWIILLNIVVYLVLSLLGLDLVSPSPADLIAFGGNIGPYTLTGENWRLLTSMFLHGGFLHLLLNMYLLFQIGFLSELAWGKLRYLGIYLITGFFGGVASAYWYSWDFMGASNGPFNLIMGQAPVTLVSVGASGALLGVAGALLVHALKQGAESIIDWKIMAQVVFLNVGMGIFDKGVDNACHIGGAAAGLLLGGLFLMPLPDLRISEKQRDSAVILGSLFFLAFILRMPAPENLQVLAMDLRVGQEELDKLEKMKQKKIKAEGVAALERNSIPASVSLEEIVGNSLTVLGGSIDFIHRAGDSFAYVPNTQSNSVSIIDLKNLKLTHEITGPTLPEVKDSGCQDNLCLGRGAAGLAVSQDGKWAMVSSLVEDSITKLDLENRKALWSVKIGRFPRNTFLSNNERFAFAVNSPDNSISAVDIIQQKLLFTEKLGDPAAGHSFGRIVGAAQARVRGKLYLADPMGNKILSLSTEAPAAPRLEIALDDFSPNKLVLSQNDTRLWVSGDVNRRGILRVYDLDSLKLVDEFFTCGGGGITEFDISPSGDRIALERNGGGTVRIISSASRASLRALPSSYGDNLLRFSGDGKKLYFMSLQGWGSALTVFDLSKTLDVKSEVEQNGELLCFDI